MEARGRRISGSLPGYNGPALPRAMRSARGRGETGSRQSSELGGRSGFFELLATVAGQFLQDASTGQEKDGEKLKQNCSQFAGSVVVTSQGISETAQSGFPPRFESGFALSGSGGTGNLLPCKQNKVPRCKASPSNANSFQGTVGFDKDTASTSIEDQKHAGAASPLSNVSTEDMSPQTLDPLGAGLATSQRIEGACCRIKDTTINSDISAVSVDCHLCTSTNRHANDCTGDHLVVRDVCDYYVRDEKLEPCKPCGPCHKQTKNGTTVRCICKLLSEEIHSCDVTIAEQKSTQDSSKGLRGPRYDSCEDAANIKEEILEHVISESTPVQKSLAVENGHRDVSGDVCMVDRTGMEDYEASNRCVCKAEEKRTGSTCERQQEKFVVDTGNCLSVNVSSIEEVVGSEEAEQVGTQSHFIVQKDHHGCELSERKGKWVLRRKSTDLSKGASAKDSYVKGLKVRKLSKAAKRNQGSVSCTKRKHAEIEPQADTDLFHCKKGYFGNVAFTRRRTSRSFSAKRNKIGDGPLDLVPNLELSAKNLTADCADGEPPAAAAKLRSAKTASVASSPAAGPSKLASKKSLEAHVKLSIKSFTVPELFVDLPESATVANLKRAVMDAAMNLLGGGLRVRVLLQGKKIPDEGVSLGQMGISRHGNPESLGFMLEPSPLPSSPTAAEDPLLVLSRAAAQPSPRYPVFSVPGLPVAGEGGRSPSKNRAGKGSSMLETEDSFEAMACEQHMLSDPNGNGLSFSLGTDDSLKACNAKAKSVSGERMTLSSHSTRVAAAGALAAIRAQADASRRAKNEADSAAVSATNDSLVSGTGAIILHPSVGADNMQGVALVPVRPKLRAIDTNKRRIRRPFSVAEVEALVHAVEKLGTGRWRDVKLRAFDQAKHRTYVDLKDKWKTLVHTARIAPHQRRGEPVPQELLERVTRAHTYWAAQQAKQQAELEF